MHLRLTTHTPQRHRKSQGLGSPLSPPNTCLSTPDLSHWGTNRRKTIDSILLRARLDRGGQLLDIPQEHRVRVQSTVSMVRTTETPFKS